MRANTWKVFKGLLGLRTARGSELKDRATEAMKPINRKKKTGQTRTGDPWDNGKCQVFMKKR